MNRITDAWFEFKGVRSDALGAYMTRMPSRELPARRATLIPVAGRSGSVRISDGAYDDITITMAFKVIDTANLTAISAWLNGSGVLRLSDDPGYTYDAIIVDPPSRDYAHQHFDPQAYSVTFSCHPFRYHYPAADDIEVTASGTIITNPGTAPSQPRVVIKGDGAFSVTIGTGADAVTMFFRGVEGGIIVDSLLGDALTYDGALLANDKIGASELFMIQPGSQAVTWINGGDADDGTELPGSIEKITITPRWCSL